MRKFHMRGASESPRFVSYANVVSTIALVAAIGGGSAIAAATHHKHHYTISSLSQIKPSVRAQLHGANGTNGAKGATGATGPTGLTGATGATGAAGAVAGLSATFTGNAVIPIGASTGNFVTVVSKVLPAGNYIVNAKAEVSASATGPNPPVDPGVEWECDLFSGASVVDTSQATVPLSQVIFIGTFLQAGSTVGLAAPLTLTATTTVSVQCNMKLPLQANDPAGFAASATNGVIDAVQVTANS